MPGPRPGPALFQLPGYSRQWPSAGGDKPSCQEEAASLSPATGSTAIMHHLTDEK